MTLTDAFKRSCLALLLASMTLLAGCSSSGAGGPEIQSTATGNNASTGDTTEAARTTQSTRPSRLVWEIPFTRVDGSPLELSEVAGYEVRAEENTTRTSEIIYVNDPTVTQMPLASLPAGQYTFRVRLIDINGLPSDYSNPVSVALN